MTDLTTYLALEVIEQALDAAINTSTGDCDSHREVLDREIRAAAPVLLQPVVNRYAPLVQAVTDLQAAQNEYCEALAEIVEEDTSDADRICARTVTAADRLNAAILRVAALDLGGL